MSTTPTDEQWKAVRAALREGILAGQIPLDSTVMKPKQVWQQYKDAKHPDMDCVDYKVKRTHDKFTRMLRSLRKKHKDGDLEHEGEKRIEWGKSAAKQFLKKCFREKLISTDYDDAEQVWKDHCEGHIAFARMEFDSAFVRRLGTVRDDYVRKLARCEKDLQAYLAAKRNHPTPKYNSRGELQWHGSAAQKLLKEAIKNSEHVGIKPADLHKSREEYQVYLLKTFRDHIYQEQRLLKFHNWLGHLKQQKLDDLQY